MLKVKVVDTAGKKVSDLKLAEGVFGIEPNKSAMHLAVVSYLASQRQGTQSTLTRAEVSGGGKKPWRQKGTGRARQGSTRAAQWVHGGIAFGPKPRKYNVGITKKTKRLALKSALSSKVAEKELTVLDDFKLDEIKTKKVAQILSTLKVGKKTLIVLPEKDETVLNSARNIAGVKVATVNTICTYDILNCNTLLVTEAGIKKIEEVYA